MVRPLSDALRSRPLFFAPVPPPGRTSPARHEERIAAAVELIRGIPRLDAIDVPELVDENHEGRPRYRTDDPRLFARTLADRTEREAIVNKVVAHLGSPAVLEAWAEETVRLGVHHAVLVGGNSRFIPYPGPPVAEANRIVRPIFDGARGLVGNIAIPQRRGEAHRMLSKTRAGASFFTTQILFASDAAAELVNEYGRLCREAGVTPAAVLLSFTPVTDEADIEFARWLGADLPEEAERRLVNGDESETPSRSVALALDVWNEVAGRAADGGAEVPLGVNVEQVTGRHLDRAAALLEAFVRPLSQGS